MAPLASCKYVLSISFHVPYYTHFSHSGRRALSVYRVAVPQVLEFRHPCFMRGLRTMKTSMPPVLNHVKFSPDRTSTGSKMSLLHSCIKAVNSAKTTLVRSIAFSIFALCKCCYRVVAVIYGNGFERISHPRHRGMFKPTRVSNAIIP